MGFEMFSGDRVEHKANHRHAWLLRPAVRGHGAAARTSRLLADFINVMVLE